MSRTVPMQFGNPGESMQGSGGGASVEYASLIPLRTFTEIYANRAARIGKVGIFTFRGKVTSGAGGTFKSILSLPAGWEIGTANTEDFRFFATVNDTATYGTVAYGNPDQDHNAIFIQNNFGSGANISFTFACVLR